MALLLLPAVCVAYFISFAGCVMTINILMANVPFVYLIFGLDGYTLSSGSVGVTILVISPTLPAHFAFRTGMKFNFV